MHSSFMDFRLNNVYQPRVVSIGSAKQTGLILTELNFFLVSSLIAMFLFLFNCPALRRAGRAGGVHALAFA